MMTWAPLVYLGMSYWFLGNNQIFDNVLFTYTGANDVILSGHTVIKDFATMSFDQSTPCFIMALILLVCLPTTLILVNILNKVTNGFFEIKLNVDENLANYFDAVDDEDRNWSVKEENHLRKAYVSATIKLTTLL